MVQEDVAEDHNHQCDDHADVKDRSLEIFGLSMILITLEMNEKSLPAGRSASRWR